MGRSILPALLISIALTAGARADIVTGLIAWYPFNGDATDISGNGNHGTVAGGLVPTTDRFSDQNGAFEFNGTNSYVYVASSPSLESPDTALTQAAWLMFYGPSQIGSAFGPVIMKSTGTANVFSYRMTSTPGSGIGVAFGDWFNSYGAAYPFELDRWYHVATVFDGSSVTFYVNGDSIQAVPAPTTIVPNGLSLTIGADTPGILEIFYGKMDDVRLYSRALTSSDIAELCDCEFTAVGDSPPPARAAILRTYPNPSAGSMTVSFMMPSASDATVSVYDVTGRLVRVLASGPYGPGEHNAVWDGNDGAGRPASSGVYFLRLETPGTSTASRMIRIR